MGEGVAAGDVVVGVERGGLRQPTTNMKATKAAVLTERVTRWSLVEGAGRSLPNVSKLPLMNSS
jgi:hypothetical protein